MRHLQHITAGSRKDRVSLGTQKRDILHHHLTAHADCPAPSAPPESGVDDCPSISSIFFLRCTPVIVVSILFSLSFLSF